MSEDPLATMNDPLHKPGLPLAHWTTDNVGEALPGVATPLGWTVWESGSDRMCRDLSYALGIFTRTERDGPAPGEDPIIQIFYGRIAMRMEWLGTVGDRMPGTSGPEAVASMLGRVPESMSFAPSARRYPVIAYKLPIAALTTPSKVRQLADSIEPWWRVQIAALSVADEAAARHALGDGVSRFRRAMTTHGIGLFALITPLIQSLTGLVERTGVGDVGQLSGTGGAEMLMVEDMWRASRGQLTVDDVLTRHGYHGPLEGELSSRVWREDPRPLERMIAAYAEKSDDDDPVLRDARARQALPQLQRDVLAAVPRVQRPAVRVLLTQAAASVPLRGVGKAAFLQAFDVTRAAARRLGELMVADGRLDDPDDVFYLTLQELLEPSLPAEVKSRVAERRARRAEYEAMRLPASWRGTPAVEPIAPRRDETGDVALTVTGIGASAGSVEGRVRVVTDASFAEVEPGEILVARTTDPSWASIMFMSAALVVDIGGVISHAAVVARELGIPAVVNTRFGTDVLCDGDRVRVDGAAGTVDVLERAPASSRALG